MIIIHVADNADPKEVIQTYKSMLESRIRPVEEEVNEASIAEKKLKEEHKLLYDTLGKVNEWLKCNTEAIPIKCTTCKNNYVCMHGDRMKCELTYEHGNRNKHLIPRQGR